MTVPPGESIVKFTPSGFAQLNLQHPRLWWPNDYGSPELYYLKLTLNDMADGGYFLLEIVVVLRLCME